jgi:hypothetical protein
MFDWIAPYLLENRRDNEVEGHLARWVKSQVGISPMILPFSIDQQVFETVKIQFMALNLVDISQDGDWSLTPNGKQQLMQLRTVKRYGSTAVNPQKSPEFRDGDRVVDPSAAEVIGPATGND